MDAATIVAALKGAVDRLLQQLRGEGNGALPVLVAGRAPKTAQRLVDSVTVAPGALWDSNAFVPLSDADRWLLYVSCTRTHDVLVQVGIDSAARSGAVAIASGASATPEGRPYPHDPGALVTTLGARVQVKNVHQTENATVSVWLVKSH